MDIMRHNREAWNQQVEKGNEWTVPVGDEIIEAARHGKWQIFLTPNVPVPRDWFPEISNAEVLCLASGGGQQGPVLAAAGARVTVFDNSPNQLKQDRNVSDRHGLEIRTVQGDMADLSCFEDESFDLIVHPVSNVFAPDILPVWKEAYRVLRHNCALISGFGNSLIYLFDEQAYERGELKVVNSLPYSDVEKYSPEEINQRLKQGTPLEFSHTLEEQMGGQIQAGFVIAGFYEDRCAPKDNDLLSKYTPTFIATRAWKE
jgi:ubiquinone/menaquinone biosynthesis C-methylase UbiE